MSNSLESSAAALSSAAISAIDELTAFANQEINRLRSRIAELDKRCDTLLAELEKQQLETVCECKNCMNARAAIASVKEQA